MSKRVRKGQQKDKGGDGDGNGDGTVPDAVAAAADTHPRDAAGSVTETGEIQPEPEPEPKRRSARLSTKPAAVAPVSAVATGKDKSTEQKDQGQAQAKRTRLRLPSARARARARPTKTESPVTPTATATPTVGYTSDGMSFEDDADDDMLPDIIMESPSKERKYLKDDIVWAPYKDVYWPAIVTSVKLPTVCFLYINDSGEHVFKKQVRHLLPFDNPTKNLELKELGDKAGSKFKEAYDLVKKYLMKRKLNNNLNARRFLTLNQNDKVAQAKTCLLRLTGSFDGFDNEEENDDNDEEMSEHALDSEDEQNDADETCGSTLHTDGRSPNEKAKVEAILRDLETLPANMTVSSDQSEEMKKEANQLLAIIRSKECFNHLMQIREGSIMSSRHMKYMKHEDVRGGLGPFTLFQDLTNELLTVLDNHCDEYDTPDYKQAVMLPEAIIYAITQVMDCSKLDAKRHFHKTCNKVGVKD